MNGEELDKEKVLRIVEEWDIEKEPEYRSFRCAKCNKVLTKAWHVWLNQGNFKLEVHFCDDCYQELKNKPEEG
ncbi:MAG: hypothetical protein ABEJ25_04160 [Candidatus Bipolaricaulia bacterium]